MMLLACKLCGVQPDNISLVKLQQLRKVFKQLIMIS